MPIAANPTPPPARKTVRAAAEKQTADRGRQAAYEETLTGIAQMASALCMMTGNYADVAAISMHGPNLVPPYARLATQNEPFGRALDWLTTAGPYSEILLVTTPFVAQILANHKLIKPVMGVQAPEILAASVEADLMMQQAEGMRRQQKAQAEMQRAHEELQRANEEASKEWDRVPTP